MNPRRKLGVTRLALPIVLVASAAAFAWPGAGTAVMAAVTASLSPDSISGLAGHKAALDLKLDLGTTGKQLASYAVSLTWDSTVVRLDSVRAGDFAAPAVNYVNAGAVNLGRATTSGQGGVLTLGRLYFRFVSSDTAKRTVIQPVFSEVTATDFSNLKADFASLAAVARVKAPPIVVGFSPDSLYERVGHRPQIDLRADLSQATGVALGSYAAAFTWDSTVMKLDSAVGAFGTFAQIHPNAGELRVTAASAAGSTGVVTLAKLYFTFQGSSFPKLTTMALGVTEMHAATSFANLLPGTTAKSGKVVIGGVLRGDIDLSGAVAALDAQKILEAVVGLTPTLPATALPVPHGDADCNGAIKARDAQLVLNQVVGNDVATFCVAKIQ